MEKVGLLKEFIRSATNHWHLINAFGSYPGIDHLFQHDDDLSIAIIVKLPLIFLADVV